MKKCYLLLLGVCLLATPLRADEGMWLPALIGQRIDDMQAKGFRLDAEDVYSVNQASLKDAVVLFGGGCTGELVSAEGLLLTNHHCGYSYIQRHSSVEHDYLKDGFWAMDRSGELPNPGLTVSFLERMEDVTSLVLRGVPEGVDEAERSSIVRENAKALEEEAVRGGNGLKARVESLYYGNQYFLFVYKVYRDVRLVGAPPSSIGKFGGETDNWMWPRHTGDFSIFRIYASPDNEPADYSADNVPYTPKRFFTISRKGVKTGDFTFVYGCPGSTREYVHSEEVRYIGEVSDPEKIALRDVRLAIMKKYMSESQAVRIQYSSKYASVANAWKKWQGESKGVAKMKTVSVKQAYEAQFKEWAVGTRFEGLTDRLAALYAARNPSYRAYEYLNETVRTVELLRLAGAMASRPLGTPEARAQAESFFKDYYQPIDEEIFDAMLSAFDERLDDAFKPAWFKEKLAAFGSVEALRKDIFARSLFTDMARVLALTEADADAVKADPAAEMYLAFSSWYEKDLKPVIDALQAQIQLLNRDYMQGQMAFEPTKPFYPDANLTLRVAYGHVEGYSPADGIEFAPVSTIKGIMEKDNPDIFDYNIPQSFRDLYALGGYDDVPVCFLATNHTSGGNSGSPVIDGDGNLIGINFDRVWEGTMSDLVFDPEVCRNISLDINYLLFVVEDIGHASHLLREMRFAE